MTSASTPPAIAVLGAAGVVGRRICAELARAGWALSIVGRTPVPLAALADTLPAARVHVADAGDAAALARAFAGVRVVVNAAGPLAETLAPVLVAALAAGAHYV
ncbi:MAG TPA: saccharopine dehydrogenase NADP-binding domain-containing protein, partial [Kofleriaceae bacterium]|nr:saccharopine dehydrogenase NADP-binding domain-containing protein [Kofleriaceae bacterium]